MNKPEIVCEHLCRLGEGPVWDTRNKCIIWIDILSGHIHQFKTNTSELQTINVDQLIGAVALCKSGYWLAALKNGLSKIDPLNGYIELISHPEAHLPQNRYNDGKCDPEGRFWIGSIGLNEQPLAGSVYMLDTNHEVSLKISNVTISNGMAWSPDHRTLYYIDTPTATVVAFDYQQNGSISSKRTVITIASGDGYPDGMTIDTEGMLWIAHWNGWQVSRWSPLTGEKLFSLPLPVANVTSCTFGGENMDDLYITTAQKDIPLEDLAKQPLAGALFVWKNCGYKGTPSFEFND